MCDPVSVIAGVTTAGAIAAGGGDDGGGQPQAENVKKSDDKEVLDPLRPTPQRARVRLGDPRSLSELARVRKENTMSDNQNQALPSNMGGIASAIANSMGIPINKQPQQPIGGIASAMGIASNQQQRPRGALVRGVASATGNKQQQSTTVRNDDLLLGRG